MLFDDRTHAGRILAEKVAALNLQDGVVLALPRGGVPVGYEVAQRCGFPLDILIVRKLGVPGQRELAMGAVASGGAQVINADIVRALGISQETIRSVAERELVEIEHQEQSLREGHPPLRIEGRIAVLVDDGLATGATMRAAIKTVQPLARQVVVAAPVASQETCDELRDEVDQIVCVSMPSAFNAVGMYYGDFHPVTNDEVRQVLRTHMSSTA